MLSVDDLITGIIQREGDKYTNAPGDRGGPTKYGITLATLSAYRKTNCAAADVESLTEKEARAIYLRRYVEASHFNLLKDDKLRTEMVDFGVNSGPAAATRALQAALGLKEDGLFGAITMDSANKSEARGLMNKLAVRRMLYLINIAVADPETQLKFLRGWANRALLFIE